MGLIVGWGWLGSKPLSLQIVHTFYFIFFYHLLVSVDVSLWVPKRIKEKEREREKYIASTGSKQSNQERKERKRERERDGCSDQRYNRHSGIGTGLGHDRDRLQALSRQRKGCHRSIPRPQLRSRRRRSSTTRKHHLHDPCPSSHSTTTAIPSSRCRSFSKLHACYQGRLNQIDPSFHHLLLSCVVLGAFAFAFLLWIFHVLFFFFSLSFPFCGMYVENESAWLLYFVLIPLIGILGMLHFWRKHRYTHTMHWLNDPTSCFI